MKLEVVNGEASSADIEALRYRAADALEKALAFVETHGDTLARMHAHVALGASPLPELLDAISPQQAEDGSFPSLGLAAAGATGFEPDIIRPIPEAVLGSLEALMLLSDLSALGWPAVAGIADFLEASQSSDGSWGSAGQSPVEKIFVTGLVAGTLGRTPVVRPDVLDRAGQFLAPLWSPEQVEGGRWGAIAAFGCFFSNVNHDLSDEALQWVGRELERGYRSRRFDAASTLRVLMHCDAGALPGATLAPHELLVDLLDEQSSDGGFAALSPDGPAGRVTPTIDGLIAIPRLCRLL